VQGALISRFCEVAPENATAQNSIGLLLLEGANAD
jgi:hypothetical protein